MTENPLLEMLTENIAKWNKLVVEIEKDKRNLFQGEDRLFVSLRDFWKKNDFAPDKCKQLLNEIASFKNKHPASDLKENLQEFRGLCTLYYTKDKVAYYAFQKAMGGRESSNQRPDPKPKPQPQPIPRPKPEPQYQHYDQPDRKSKTWIIPVVVFCVVIIAIVVKVWKSNVDDNVAPPVVVAPVAVDTVATSKQEYNTNDAINFIKSFYTATTKAFFYNEPNESTIRKAYLVVGDVVNITMVQNGFGHTVFTNATGQTTEGWVKMSELQANNGSKYTWLIGTWRGDESSINITFKTDGTYQIGGDCTGDGTYAIVRDMVYLNGKMKCNGGDGSFQGYSENVAIQGNTLEHYKKVNKNTEVQPSQSVINPDDVLQKTITKSIIAEGDAFSNVVVAVKDLEVTLTGEINRANLQQLMQIVNQAKPQKVINYLTIR